MKMKTTKKDIERYIELKEEEKRNRAELEKLASKFKADILQFGIETKENSCTISIGNKHHVTVTTSYPQGFDKKSFETEHPALYSQYVTTGKRENLYVNIDD